MSYKEEGKDLTYYKANAEEDYMQVPISVLRYITELEKKVKQSQSNLLDQKIEEEGVTSQDAYEFLKTWESKGDNQSIPVSEMCADYANHVLRQEREELKRLKEENEKLVNSVGEWSALAIDRKQDLDEANKNIEEGREALNDIVWLIERGASMDEIKESVNAKARPFLITNKTK